MENYDLSNPDIRVFQQDFDAVGILKNSVNLFQGTVNFMQKFFTLPGRNENDGLGLEVSAVYQSKLARKYDIKNSESPTGILGLGWEMSIPEITLNDPALLAKGARSYSIYMDGIRSELIREQDDIFLFHIQDFALSDIESRTEIPAALREKFLSSGIGISREAEVTAQTAGTCLIVDEQEEQEFVAVSRDGGISVYCGGEAYQLAKYQFWRVIYYPRFERWSVTKEDGSRYSFGGGLHLIKGKPFYASAGNSVSFRVCWLSENGAWTGGSIRVEDQKQYAVRWRLEKSFGRYAEGCTLSYNDFEREENGLLADAEQFAAYPGGGLPYTRASYLTKIVDLYGRTVRFFYGEKSNDSDKREYAPPHKSPNGCQDCYETKYLDRIVVNGPNGSMLFQVSFKYELTNLAGGSDSELYKRLLIGYEVSYPNGQAGPGYSFTYYTKKDKHANIGAIKSIKWPSGGVVRYEYQERELPECRHDRDFCVPSGMPAGSEPGIWFGTDYAVILWNDRPSGRLSLQIASWNGRWILWTPAEGSAVLVTESSGIDMAAIRVMTGRRFAAVTYSVDGYQKLYLLRRNAVKAAAWELVSSGGQKAYKIWNLKEGALTTAYGGSFFAAVQSDAVRQTYTYQVDAENWAAETWESAAGSLDSMAAVCAGEHCLILAEASGKVTAFYQDGKGGWIKSSCRLEQADANVQFDTEKMKIALSDSIGAISCLTSGTHQKDYHYTLYLLHWDEQGCIRLHAQKFELLDPYKQSGYTPRLYGSGMVAVSGHMLKYDGKRWNLTSALTRADITPQSAVYYDYAMDWGVSVHMQNGTAHALLTEYSPENGWTTPVKKQLTYPKRYKDTMLIPHTDGRCCLILDGCYYHRDSAQSWEEALKNGVDLNGMIEGNYLLNPAALSNQCPYFAASSFYKTDSTLSKDYAAGVFIIKNGYPVKASRLLSGYNFSLPAEGRAGRNGANPFGAQMFAAYPDKYADFASAKEFKLCHYALDGVTDTVREWSVSRVCMDNGMQKEIITDYEPDLRTATVSKDAETVKFYKTAVYPGGRENPGADAFAEVCYLNGNGGCDEHHSYCQLLDGYLHCVTYKNRNGETISKESAQWDCYTDILCAAGVTVSGAIRWETRKLYGSCVCKKAESKEVHQVVSTKTYSYKFPFGNGLLLAQPKSAACLIDHADGMDEQVEEFEYLPEVCAQATAQHLLTCQTQASASFNDVVISRQKIRYGSFKALNRQGALVLDVACMERLSNSRTDSGKRWQPFKSVISRDALTGQVTQGTEEGKRQANFYSSRYQIPTASFEGAEREECAFTGFFPYADEEADGFYGTERKDWSYAADAVFGNRSLLLAPGEEIRTSVTPKAHRKNLICAVRCKSNDSLEAVFGKKTILLEATGGEWDYKMMQVSMLECAGGAGRETAVSIRNCGSQQAFIDSIMVMPEMTGFHAVYRRESDLQVEAGMDESGNVQRILYDLRHCEIGRTSSGNQLKRLQLDIPGTDLPNLLLDLQPAGGGYVQAFEDEYGQRAGLCSCPGDAAKSAWSCFGSAGKWTWPVHNPGNRGIAVYVQVSFNGDVKDGISISFGQGQRIAWSQNGWELDNGRRGDSAAMKPGSHWLLLLKEDLILFYSDGRILFAEKAQADLSGDITLDFGGNPAALHYLAAAYDPRLKITYKDGAGQERQIHTLSGSGSLISEKAYDALGRAIVSTRTAPCDGCSNPKPLLWKEDFFDTDYFFGSGNQNASAKGAVADYYASDRGYPFYRRRYEAFTDERVIEEGQPGAERAIIPDPDGKTASGSKKIRYYAAGSNSRLAKETTTPDQYSYVLYQDKIGRNAGTKILDAAQKEVSKTEIRFRYGYDEENGTAVSITEEYLPKTFDPEQEGGKKDAYRIRIEKNSLDEICKYHDNDTGLTEYIYDEYGNVRFVHTQGTGNGFYYKCYDEVSRLVEEGFCPGSWDYQSLQEKARDASYPVGEAGAAAARKYRYGRDAARPFDLNKLVEIVTYNYADGPDPNAGIILVTESWSYNIDGQTASARMKIEGAGECFEAGIDYRYNNLGELVSLTYQDGAKDGDQPEIRFAYDDMGQMVSIDSISHTGDACRLASFAWTCEGKVRQAIRGNITEEWLYDSVGNVLSHCAKAGTDIIFHQEFSYLLTGLIKSFRQSGYTYEYGYDAMCQVTSVEETDRLNQRRKTEICYDANGNVISRRNGTAHMKFHIQAGTNQLTSVETGEDGITGLFGTDGDGMKNQYRADGRPAVWRGMDVSTCRALNAINSIRSGGHTLRCIRGASDRIVMTVEDGEKEIYFQGTGQLPQVYWQNGKAFYCIWGPAGLAAVLGKDTVWYPLSDHLGTVWRTASPAGRIQMSFSYDAFGNITAMEGDGAGNWPFLFQGRKYYGHFGLYSFQMRFYDPLLMRFLEPDTAHQFASPYTFVGNNPLRFVDPDGALSLGEKIGIYGGFSLLILAGIALSIVTAGITAPLIAGEAATLSTAAAGIAISAVSGTIAGTWMNMSISAITYTAKAGRFYTAKGLKHEIDMGAAAGAAAGAVSGLIAGMTAGIAGCVINGMQNSSSFVKGLVSLTMFSIGDIMANDASAALSDVITKTPITGIEMAIASTAALLQGISDGLFSIFGPECSKLTQTGSAWEKMKEALANLGSQSAKNTVADSCSIVLSNAFGTAGSVIYTEELAKP